MAAHITNDLTISISFRNTYQLAHILVTMSHRWDKILDMRKVKINFKKLHILHWEDMYSM